MIASMIYINEIQTFMQFFFFIFQNLPTMKRMSIEQCINTMPIVKRQENLQNILSKSPVVQTLKKLLVHCLAISISFVLMKVNLTASEIMRG